VIDYVKKQEFALVFLCTEKTIRSCMNNFQHIINCMKPKEVFVICSAHTSSLISNEEKETIQIIDEDTLVEGMTFSSVKESIKEINPNGIKRTGWYFQQFLKLGFALKSEDDLYLVWDSDTLPLKETCMFQNDKMYFDVKEEFNVLYFDTISKILPRLRKKENYSFISEHMMFHSGYVRKMLEEISRDDVKDFWKVIIKNIPPKQLDQSGFSEFETYGTYMTQTFPDVYEIRKWKSLREGALFFRDGLSVEKRDELSHYFDAISFEEHDVQKKLTYILSNRFFQKIRFIRFFEGSKGIVKNIFVWIKIKKYVK